jgi:hypothetical protein
MRNLLIVASLLAMSSAAMAADGRRMYGHNRSARGGYSNVLPWVAGGLALGALAGGAYYYDRSPPRYRSECYEDMIGYDRYGREIWRKYCN